MNFLKNLFSNAQPHALPIKVDMHSHLLPNLDDGSQSIASSLQMIEGLMDLGFEQFICTPHIMGDFYKNSSQTILPALDQVREELDKANKRVNIRAAAEYYIDEWFQQKITSGNRLLTLKDDYVLVETSYINPPSRFKEVIFDLQSLGYQVVLAHPERYTYLYQSFEKFQELYALGIKFQLNLNSLSGYYSPAAKKFAEKLIDHQMVDFVGTDCHAPKHLERLKQTMNMKYFGKLASLSLLNDSLAE